MIVVNAELRDRALNLVKLNGGRATLEQIRAGRIIPGPLVTEVMRSLVSGKHLAMEGEATYVLLRPTVAESRQLAGTPAAGTDPQQHRPLTPVKSVGGPAEPEPRKKGRPRREGTQAPSKPIACLRCQMQFPPQEFDAGPGRRRFRLCCTCGDRMPAGSSIAPPADTAPAAVPEPRPPVHDIGDLAAKWTNSLSLDLTRIRPYLDLLLQTGLYGNSLEQCVERLLTAGIERAIATGILKLESNDD